MGNIPAPPFLIPFQAIEFWQEMRKIIREELKDAKIRPKKETETVDLTQLPGLIEKTSIQNHRNLCTV